MTAIQLGRHRRPRPGHHMRALRRRHALSMVERLLTTLAVLTIFISALDLAKHGATACALIALTVLPFINPLLAGRKGGRR